MGRAAARAQMNASMYPRYAIDLWPLGLVLGATTLALAPFALPLPPWAVACLWVTIVYLRTFCAFAQHNHAHLPVFRAPLLNGLYDALLAMSTGYATAVWELHHNCGHHRHYLRPDADVASPYHPGTRRPMPRWRYALRGNLTIHRDAVRIGLAEGRAGRKTRLPKLAFELSVQLALTAALIAYRPWLGLSFFVLPNAMVAWLIWWESYPHHVGLPTTSPHDASMTLESRAYNRVTFNIGHHAAHHRKPTLHWSRLPEQTERMRAVLDPRTIRRDYRTVAGRFRLPVRAREARTEDYRPGEGLHVAMIGDSTVRDFAIAASVSMLWRQWFGNGRNPFLDRSGGPIASVFERLAAQGPVRAVECARSGASVGAARTFWRRHFQWIANVKTLSGQVDELLREAELPDLTLVWIGHNNLDFVTELPRFSRCGDLDAACEGLALAFTRAFRSELGRLVERAQQRRRPSAIVVYGLVNPQATRLARDRARDRKARCPGLYPYLEVAEARFPPLRPEHAERLIALSRRLSAEMARVVADLRAQPCAARTRVHLAYSDATARMDFSRPELLSRVDAWHASEAGKALIASALFEGMAPALDALAAGSGAARERTGTDG